LLILVLAACGVGRPAEDASGAEIYNQLCANCHAEDLSGGLGPPLGPGSNSADQPDEFLEIAIVNGRGRMPSFSSSLEDGQLELLIAYIREAQQE
jgi:cytochrome c551